MLLDMMLDSWTGPDDSSAANSLLNPTRCCYKGEIFPLQVHCPAVFSISICEAKDGLFIFMINFSLDVSEYLWLSIRRIPALVRYHPWGPVNTSKSHRYYFSSQPHVFRYCYFPFSKYWRKSDTNWIVYRHLSLLQPNVIAPTSVELKGWCLLVKVTKMEGYHDIPVDKKSIIQGRAAKPFKSRRCNSTIQRKQRQRIGIIARD